MENKYIDRIKQVYPDLPIEDYEMNDIGQNNDVMIVNNSLVFRFPKYENGIVRMREEKAILVYLKNRLPVPVPSPSYQSFDELKAGKVFTGYPLIPGEPLWKDRLAAIDDPQKTNHIASQLAEFLAALHSISKEEIDPVHQLEHHDPREEMAELFFNIQTKLFPYIRKEAREEISYSFTSFLESSSRLNLRPTLIHGDFGSSNIIWDPETSKITGIIDFGGSGLGDPAYDFAGILSSYGKEFYHLCINLYPKGSEISERVMFYRSTFSLQEALHGFDNDDDRAFENGLKDYC